MTFQWAHVLYKRWKTQVEVGRIEWHHVICSPWPARSGLVSNQKGVNAKTAHSQNASVVAS
jgi:hypothetical protein